MTTRSAYELSRDVIASTTGEQVLSNQQVINEMDHRKKKCSVKQENHWILDNLINNDQIVRGTKILGSGIPQQEIDFL